MKVNGEAFLQVLEVHFATGEEEDNFDLLLQSVLHHWHADQYPHPAAVERLRQAVEDAIDLFEQQI